MPFDYQMVAFEEIIKNDFFKWTQVFKFRKWFKYGLMAQKFQKQHALNQRSPARSGKVKGKSFPLTQTFKAKTTKNGRKILYCLLFSVSLHPFLKFSSINRIIQKNRYDK